MQRVFEAYLGLEARIRCAIVALALERFRGSHDRWVQTLDELCPNFLARIPADPYSGQALKYRSTKDGVVVFSGGPDGKLRGSFRDDVPLNRLKLLYEFRLWNVPQRRLPKKHEAATR